MIKNKNKKGFTIVELVIVIAVIAILAAVLIPTFSNIIKSARESADTQLVKNLNTAVATEMATTGKDKATTPHETILCAKDAGYDVSVIAAKSGYSIAWSKETGSFVLIDVNGKTAIYPTSTGTTELKVEGNEVDYFLIISSTNDAATGYSIYAGDGWDEAVINLDGVGFDAGYSTKVTTINYTNTTGDAHDVVIRTNSAAVTLTVNDQSTGKIYHYGEAGILDIIQCHTGSYYENGKVAYVDLAKGRIVLTETSDVEAINIVAKDASSYNNPIIADGGVKEENMPAIVSRDQVAVSGQTELVQIQKTDANGNTQGTAEQIYAYESGTTGTTEKTSTQNTTVSSNLGVKVLDASAGEKAYTEVQQAAEKFEVAKEATEEQIKSSDTTYACYINGYPYETLADALTAATDGQTVTLLADSDASGLGASEGKTVTLDLGDFELTNESGYTISQYSSGTLIIKGSENSRINGIVYTYATKVIFDSSFEGKVEQITIANSGSLVINGGNFKKIINAIYSWSTSTVDPTNYLSEGYTYETVDGYYHVIPITAENAVASVVVGEETFYYVSIGKALEKVKNGGTVTLYQDYDATTTNDFGYNYSAEGTIIFDLNGHTWSLSSGSNNVSPGIRLYSGNLTVKSSKEGGRIYSEWGDVFDIRGGNLTIESGNFAGDGSIDSIIADEASSDYTITINGGSFAGTLRLNEYCKSAIITGGSFGGGILTKYQKDITVDISGGTFNDGQINSMSCNNGTFNISGGIFNCYLGNGGTFNISGGTFNVNPNIGGCFASNSNTTFNVSGGTFGEDITKNSRVTISSGYKWDSTTNSVITE